jgi:predicted Zn-ribbon and HTH transcriptional regulator
MAGLKTKPEYGDLAQAVSLGIAVLKKAKKNTWDELAEAMATDDPVLVKAFKALDLTSEQLALISEYQKVLGLVRIAPPVIPAVCPACGYFVLTNDTAPSKCQVTASCTGKPAKVAAATAFTP